MAGKEVHVRNVSKLELLPSNLRSSLSMGQREAPTRSKSRAARQGKIKPWLNNSPLDYFHLFYHYFHNLTPTPK